ERIQAGYDAPVVPLAELLPGTTSPLGAPDEWRPVEVVGEYLPEHTVLLRNRPVQGQPGYHVLVPLLVTGAEEPAVLVVDRGWAGGDAAAAEVPAPPAGQVTVT